MKNIKVLSPHLANQIAAGEVVERPLSVVKELVENAVDAGATSVNVDITGGGIEYIRVSDNGSGIEKEDVEMAFCRHATSKLATIEQLSCIETLGFRGEALASIASVAEVKVKTRVPGSQSGTLFEIAGGEIRANQEYGCPDGTSVEVSNLFFNVPVRLKFLKAPKTEANGIIDYISRMMLARPDISFRLSNNGKSIYHSSGNGSLEAAIFEVYGNEVLDQLKPVDFDDGYVRFSGFTSTAQLARPNKQQQSFFVNGRYIKAFQLSAVLQRTYGDRLMGGKYPLCVINIHINANEVDVNVHPNKMEVKFKNEQRICGCFSNAIGFALDGSKPPMIEWRQNKPQSHAHTLFGQSTDANQPLDRMVSTLPLPSYTQSTRPTLSDSSDIAADVSILNKHTAQYNGDTAAPAASDAPKINFSAASEQPMSVRENARSFDFIIKQDGSLPVVNIKREVKEQIKIEPKPEQVGFGVAPYVICGKLFDTYWIVQQDENVFYIDQHAAHERILYEKLAANQTVSSQALLIPQTVKLSAQDYQCVIENLERFSELGFDISEMGSFTICVRAVPIIMGQPQAADFIRDAVESFRKHGKGASLELKRDILIQSACKHAVKAGNVLDKAEIEFLLNEFTQKGIPLTCPHGRPIMVQTTRRELEKMFKRVL